MSHEHDFTTISWRCHCRRWNSTIATISSKVNISSLDDTVAIAEIHRRRWHRHDIVAKSCSYDTALNLGFLQMWSSKLMKSEIQVINRNCSIYLAVVYVLRLCSPPGGLAIVISMLRLKAPPRPCPINAVVVVVTPGIADNTDGSNAESCDAPNCNACAALQSSVVLLNSCDCGILKFSVGTAFGIKFVTTVVCVNSILYSASSCWSLGVSADVIASELKPSIVGNGA